MGRGTAKEVEALKAHIVRESTRLFAARGFAGTSVSQIAAASGVSKALIIYHFGSKDALRGVVISDLSNAWGALLPRLAAASLGSGDPVQTAFAEAFAMMRDNPNMGRLILREIMSEDRTIADQFEAQSAPVLLAAGEAIRQLRGGTLPDGFDPQAMFTFFGLAFVAVLSVFPPDDDGALTGNDDLGERVLMQGLRAVSQVLGAPVSDPSAD